MFRASAELKTNTPDRVYLGKVFDFEKNRTKMSVFNFCMGVYLGRNKSSQHST